MLSKTMKKIGMAGSAVAAFIAPAMAFAAIPTMSGGTLGSSAAGDVASGASNVLQTFGSSIGAIIPLQFLSIGGLLVVAVVIWAIFWPLKGVKRMVRH